MADKNKKEEKSESKPSIKTKEFPLKKPYNGKEIGEKVKLGPEAERFFQFKNRI
ncbi:hypothetical protein [Salinimicrobium sp. GXAS 041]|uniref:hypothetical protein n=1 Tax=Salinimicrobium sp. GXAS 041 TaxID=3400806 RepID=UPI003C74C2BE